MKIFELDQTFLSNILRHEQCLIVQHPRPTRCWMKMVDLLAGALRFLLVKRTLVVTESRPLIRIVVTWAVLVILHFVSASVEVFLRLLQKQYQWSTNSLKEVLNKLSKDDVTSVKLLSMCWRDVQDKFPFGMKKMVEKELRNRGMIP